MSEDEKYYDTVFYSKVNSDLKDKLKTKAIANKMKLYEYFDKILKAAVSKK